MKYLFRVFCGKLTMSAWDRTLGIESTCIFLLVVSPWRHMIVMASQINNSTVCPTDYSDNQQRKGGGGGSTGNRRFPSQRASGVECVSMSWRLYALSYFFPVLQVLAYAPVYYQRARGPLSAGGHRPGPALSHDGRWRHRLPGRTTSARKYPHPTDALGEVFHTHAL